MVLENKCFKNRSFQKNVNKKRDAPKFIFNNEKNEKDLDNF